VRRPRTAQEAAGAPNQLALEARKKNAQAKNGKNVRAEAEQAKRQDCWPILATKFENHVARRAMNTVRQNRPVISMRGARKVADAVCVEQREIAAAVTEGCGRSKRQHTATIARRPPKR